MIPAIIFLVIDPYKRIPFVRFHAMQCILYSVAVTVFYVILGMVWGLMLHLLPFLVILSLIIYPVLWLFFFAVWAFCVYKASQGEWFKLPILGDLALKMAKS